MIVNATKLSSFKKQALFGCIGEKCQGLTVWNHEKAHFESVPTAMGCGS